MVDGKQKSTLSTSKLDSIFLYLKTFDFLFIYFFFVEIVILEMIMLFRNENDFCLFHFTFDLFPSNVG